MNQSQKIIILLGPNGVGKTHICKVLEKNRFGKYYSIEEFFIKKYGTLDEFKEHRDEGYRAFESVIRSVVKDQPIIFEESGISDEATEMINRMRRDFQVYLVDVIADLEKCIERVKQRGTSENFPKDDDFVINSERIYLERAQHKYDFDLRVENNDLTDTQIFSIFSSAFNRE